MLDYAIAGLGALQVYRNYLENKEKGIENYYAILGLNQNCDKEDIQKNYDQNSSLTMGDIIKLPEIFSTSMYENDDELKVVFFETLNNALNEIEENRINEGRNIESDILMRIQLIKDIMNDASINK